MTRLNPATVVKDVYVAGSQSESSIFYYVTQIDQSDCRKGIQDGDLIFSIVLYAVTQGSHIGKLCNGHAEGN